MQNQEFSSFVGRRLTNVRTLNCDTTISRHNMLLMICFLFFFCLVGYLALLLNFQFEPFIQKGNEGFVHHLILYECHGDYDESDFDQGVDCDDLPNMPYAKCRAASFVAAWAVGGQVCLA